MRITHLRQADLNLLIVFAALAEERNVTRAASRLLLEETTFRIAVTDHASHVLRPLICRMVLPKTDKVSIEFVSFGDQTFDSSRYSEAS